MDLQSLLDGAERRQLLRQYDEVAEQLLQVARCDGHFAGRDPDSIHWPGGDEGDEAVLERRARLVTAIHDGIPPRRDARLHEAHARYQRARPAYYAANRLFLRLRQQFCARGAGDERDFLQLYHEVYLQALGRDDPIRLDEGEEALVQLRVARVPLSHAHAIAGKISAPGADDPRWQQTYAVELDGQTHAGSLRQLLEEIAEKVVDFLAAGELLAIRYNTFSNFIWLGISIWKAVADGEWALARLRGAVPERRLEPLREMVLAGKAMLLKFFRAHLEDPAQIKPREYWYGQEYSYLTRDLMDLARELVRRTNPLAQRARQAGVELPPLLDGRVQGRFLEYPHVVRSRRLSTWDRRWRLLRWALLFRRTGKRKLALLEAGLDEEERLRRAWEQNREWAHQSLAIFDIQVDIRIDPLFAALALDLDLPRRKILFLPTHQSVFDHPVMNYVLNHPDFARAMGWEGPTPCAILARSQLTAMGSIKLFGRTFTPIGFAPEEVDRLMEEVDGHVVMSRAADTGSPVRRFAQLLARRPGVVYPAGTTSAHALQCLPVQHALFAHLPPDLVLIPLAFRGIHSLWPKCPRGNLRISPGRVEVVVGAPIPGETTLLPRKRALRTQLEPATLFQAIHIADLYNPEPST